MKENNPIEYSGEVLNQRNSLTGPDDEGKTEYPKRPQHVIVDQRDSGHSPVK